MTNEQKSTIKKYIKLGAIITSSIFAACLLLLVGIIGVAKVQGPPKTHVAQATFLYANDGSKIGAASGAPKRYWVPYNKISNYVVDAVIATEDRKFFDHHGFDFQRIAGAILVNVQSLSKAQGASTITQQYARNLYLTLDKTWVRKFLEAYYTVRLEANYSKQEILEGYLNTIYFGHGAYGIEAASKYYFQKSASELTLGEASILAGIPKGPSIYSPLTHFENAKDRQHIVLQSMVKEGYITSKQAKTAEEESLAFSINKEAEPKVAPYFQDEVVNEAASILKINRSEIPQYGLKIYTTLDKKIQSVVEAEIKRQYPKGSDVQLGIMSMDVHTGAVRAMVGGVDYTSSTFNRVTQGVRQPGSTIKPLLYYTALQNGFTPSTTMKSEYTSFVIDGYQDAYRPGNFNNYYADDFITMAEAIAVSDNVFAVKTHLFLGEGALIKTARKMGITSHLAKVPSLALGASPVRIEDMMNSYAILANNGQDVHPRFITQIEDNRGNVLYNVNDEEKPKQILNKQSSFITTQLMRGMFDPRLNSYMPVTGASIAHSLTHRYAGKSGSTNTDSWMIGFSPDLLTGVWVGYDKGKLLEKPDEKMLSRNLWAQIMEKSLHGYKNDNFHRPSGLVRVLVDPQTGHLATKKCPVSKYLYYKAGTQPIESCDLHDKNAKDKNNPDGKSNPGFIERFKKMF